MSRGPGAAAAYRDPLTGVRQRVAELRAQADDLRRRIAWLMWATTDPAVRTRLHAIRDEEPRLGDDAGALHARERLLEEEVVHLARIVAEIPGALAALRAMPPGAPDPSPFGPPGLASSPLQLDEIGLGDASRPVVDLVESLDRDATIAMGEDGVQRARFRVDAVPFAATMLKELDPFYISRRVWFRLAVHVPPVVPPLEIAPAHVLSELGAFLGLLVDRRTGDQAFDDAFRVALPHDAVSLVTSEVRDALIQMRDQRSLRLHVVAGVARLDWAGPVTVDVWRAALAALGGLRRAAVDLGGGSR